MHDRMVRQGFSILCFLWFVVAAMHVGASGLSAAGLSIGRPFSDHMVLQRRVELPVWGQSQIPGSTVVVRLGDEEQSTTVDADGRWFVRFQAREASAKPVRLTVINAGETLQLKDILIGEVWICAGQSNMEWPLGACLSADEAQALIAHPAIRLLNYQSDARGGGTVYSESLVKALTKDAFYSGNWQPCNPESSKRFSAVGYYFGRRLHETLEVPIGLICVASGGTPAEAWVSRDALVKDPELKSLVEGNWLENSELDSWCRERARLNLSGALAEAYDIPGDDLGPNHSFKPGFMWEAAVDPLIPFPMRGVIWYQGESNAQVDWRVEQHDAIFRRLVLNWREMWGQGDFPFLYVQLPGLKRPAWPMFREHQRRMIDQLPNLGMAVTIDLGHPTNVHPTNKAPVGERLARLALSKAYERKDSVAEGPIPVAWEIKDGKVLVSFDSLGDGSGAEPSMPLSHFEVADSSGEFFPARAKLIGSQVVVESDIVHQPVAVRYAWVDYPVPPVNFYNSEGLPASPFLIDVVGSHAAPANGDQ